MSGLYYDERTVEAMLEAAHQEHDELPLTIESARRHAGDLLGHDVEPIAPGTDGQRDIIVKQREALHTLIRLWPGGVDSVSFAGVSFALKGVVAPRDWPRLGGPPPKGRCGYEQFEPDSTSTPISLEVALEGINAIRNSIIGAQAFNWSEHGYPLVSLLNRAGYEGLPYPEAKANVGTLIEFRERALELLQAAVADGLTLGEKLTELMESQQ